MQSNFRANTLSWVRSIFGSHLSSKMQANCGWQQSVKSLMTQEGSWCWLGLIHKIEWDLLEHVIDSDDMDFRVNTWSFMEGAFWGPILDPRCRWIVDDYNPSNHSWPKKVSSCWLDLLDCGQCFGWLSTSSLALVFFCDWECWCRPGHNFLSWNHTPNACVMHGSYSHVVKVTKLSLWSCCWKNKVILATKL